jgi:hypothetical protein
VTVGGAGAAAVAGEWLELQADKAKKKRAKPRGNERGGALIERRLIACIVRILANNWALVNPLQANSSSIDEH